MADVELRNHPRFGRSAFACRAFAPGEVVICEEPLLTAANPGSQQTVKHELCLQLMLQEDGVTPGLAGILPNHLSRFLAWSDASLAVQRQVLGSLLHTAECKSAAVNICGHAATFIVKGVLPRVPGLLPPEVCPPGATRVQQREVVEKVLLAWELNAHGDGNRSAVYELGSKLPHTCGAPNTQWRSFNGRCYHVALAHIAPGELLTTTYIDDVLDALMPTPMRRRLLRSNYGFFCRCERCEAAHDDTRDLPCPRCVPRADNGKLPTEVATGAASPSGVLTIRAAAATTSGSASGQRGSSPSGQAGTSSTPGPTIATFRCSTCGLTVPCTDSPLASTDAAVVGVRGHGVTQPLNLDGMTDLEGALCDAAWKCKEYEWVKVCGLVTAAGRWLGPGHWAVTSTRLVRSEAALKEFDQRMAYSLKMSTRLDGARLTELLHVVEGDWRHVWRWLNGRTSLQQLHPAYPVYVRLTADARALAAYGDALDVAAAEALVPGPAAAVAAAQSRRMAAVLLGWVEPVMRLHLRLQRTPSAHPIVEVEAELRRRLGMPVPQQGGTP